MVLKVDSKRYASLFLLNPKSFMRREIQKYEAGIDALLVVFLVKYVM